jgi:hypothetical protein
MHGCPRVLISPAAFNPQLTLFGLTKTAGEIFTKDKNNLWMC